MREENTMKDKKKELKDPAKLAAENENYSEDNLLRALKEAKKARRK